MITPFTQDSRPLGLFGNYELDRGPLCLPAMNEIPFTSNEMQFWS
jgi:hypothetical protein